MGVAMTIGADGSAQLDADTKKLRELGYAQKLRRRMSSFSNFAVSFTIISILSGCLTAYGIAMTNGGPVQILIERSHPHRNVPAPASTARRGCLPFVDGPWGGVARATHGVPTVLPA